MSNKVHVKTGDEVVVINGKYRGKRGKVLQVSPSEGKVIVEGVNIVTKHVKPRSAKQQGGIIKAEGPVQIRFSSFAPSAADPPEPAARSTQKARKSAHARRATALQNSNKGGA